MSKEQQIEECEKLIEECKDSPIMRKFWEETKTKVLNNEL